MNGLLDADGRVVTHVRLRGEAAKISSPARMSPAAADKKENKNDKGGRSKDNRTRFLRMHAFYCSN